MSYAEIIVGLLGFGCLWENCLWQNEGSIKQNHINYMVPKKHNRLLA